MLLILVVSILLPAGTMPVGRAEAPALQSSVTAYDLIIAMNTLRMSYGLPALVEDPIINAVAQTTAQIMADNQMSWHIGDVSGRLQSAGYGGGSKVWGTENFAVGSTFTIDEIMVAWADPSHMIPAVNPAYCNVGAGVATSSNGLTYFVLQAAYTAGTACGEYKPPQGFTPQPGGTGQTGGGGIIVAVQKATPDAEGKIYHEVKSGQSFWAIAVAYQITIKDIETWNNISRDSGLQIGQKLFIPDENTEGYATPTPVGMFLASTPDADGKIVHMVQPYQTLLTISDAYKVNMDALLALNGWQVDWPLQIGQELLVDAGNITPSPTPRPLTPLEKLTPANDGKYYHTVQSGETLSWIADLYEVSLNDLMRWNGLGESSILQPQQQLLLDVLPPATSTPTAGPPTSTPSITIQAPSPTASATPQPSQTPLTATAVSPSAASTSPGMFWLLPVGLLAGGIALFALFARKR